MQSSNSAKLEKRSIQAPNLGNKFGFFDIFYYWIPIPIEIRSDRLCIIQVYSLELLIKNLYLIVKK